ncbi:MAG: HAMP domain-containing histidine kinase [Clostridiales bacterium]|nr:HAMP domain-containing histidine kinase [Clostridiales bacterium]MDD7773868.1 HAMP domain-containing sensor histidine kinase [Eubacteriales bacterium]
MLRKLRRRFIGAALTAFTTVIVLLLCVINVANGISTTRQLDHTLTMLMEEPTPPDPTAIDGSTGKRAPSEPNPTPDMPENAASPPKAPFLHDGFSPEVRFMLRYFSVDCDADGNVTAVELDADYIASITEEVAREYAAFAMARGRTYGFVSQYRYKIAQNENGYCVVFLNAEREMGNIRSLFWLTGGIALASIALLTVLILAFSHRAIRPYLRNLEAQKEFITNAGHELKTPLAAISASADVLDMELPDNEWVTTIRAEVQKMGKRIADLITLSRLDEENPFPERLPFSVSDAVWEASEPFASRCAAQALPFVREIDDDVTATGDAAAVMQVCSILLDNAVRYTLPSPNGRIWLSVTRKGKRARIVLENTCALSPDTDVDRLFERFYRGDAAHPTRSGSGGIGLSIAYATMRSLGGTITAKRIPGEGEPERIRFTVQL